MFHEPGSLNLLDPKLVSKIRECSSVYKLRFFAYKCAEFALSKTGITNPTLLDLLNSIKNRMGNFVIDSDIKSLSARISRLVQEYDDTAFSAQEAFENNTGIEEDYIKKFSQARAATSVLMCLHEKALDAAADACYEAYHATKDIESLVDLAERYL